MTIRRMLWGFMIAAALVCLLPTANRFRTEQRNRRVEISLDITEIRKLASSEGLSLTDTLVRLKRAGATSVLVQEDSLDNLRDLGVIEILPSSKHQTTLLIVHQRQYDRIRHNLSERSAAQVAIPEQFSGIDLEDAGIVVADRWDAIKDLGVGIDPEVVSIIREAGLGVVGRVGNVPNPTEARIKATLNDVRSLKIETVIFSGLSVLGAGNRYKDTVRNLSERPMLQFGSVEFGKQTGDTSLVKLAPYNVIRVHTITSSEMVTASPGANIQRFALAARERNIRLLFVRLFLDGADPLQSATTYVSALNNALYRSQLGVGTARTYKRIGDPFVGRVAAGLIVVIGLALLLDFIVGILAVQHSNIVLLTVVGIVTVAVASGIVPIIKLIALVGACVMPSLGVAMLHPAFKIPGSSSVSRIVAVLAVTLLGALTVIAMHADTVFLVKGDTFFGVKLTLIAPLGVALVIHGCELRAANPTEFSSLVRRRLQMLKDIIRNPIMIWQMLLGAGILFGMAIMLMRSGNESSVGVSSLELQIRSFLDRILFVRPRFKDILFQPFVVLSIVLGGTKWPVKRVASVLASIALASMVNTFCHLHTPLFISALRVTYGVVFGLITAVIVKAIVERKGKSSIRETVSA